MSLHQVNTVESLNPTTTNLVLRGKQIELQRQNGTLVINGDEVFGGGGGSGGNVVFFDPNIVATTGNRYKTWTEVVNAVTAHPSPVVDVYVHIPGETQFAFLEAGTFDLSKMNLKGTSPSYFPTLVCGDGVQFNGIPNDIDNVLFYMYQKTDVPLFTLTGPAIKFVRCDRAVFIRQLSSPPLFSISNDFNLQFNLKNVAYDYDFISHTPNASPPPTPLVHIDDVQSRFVISYGGGTYDSGDCYLLKQSDIFSGAGSVSIYFDVRSMPDFQIKTHAAFTGVLNISLAARDFIEVNRTYNERFRFASMCSSTNVNISTLQFGTNIDGYSVSEDENIVLLIGQTNPVENGLYIAFQNSPAQRLSTFDSNFDVIGAVVSVRIGSTNGGKLFQVVTPESLLNVGVAPLLFTEVRLIKTTPTVITDSSSIDLRLSDIYHIDPSGNILLALTNFSIGCKYKFVIRQDATPYTVGFSSTPSTKWANSIPYVATNSANAIDIVTVYHDGTNLLGSFKQAYS